MFDEGTTWWESYSKRKSEIYCDQKNLQTISSIQNFYESFCTSRNLIHEPTFEEDLIHKEDVPSQDTENEEIEMPDDLLTTAEIENEDDIYQDFSRNEFVRQLATLNSAPTIVEAKDWPESVSLKNAELAITENDSQFTEGKIFF